VIFGSDADGVEPAVALAKVRGAEIGDADRRLILGDNLAALLPHV
jgi:predicted TIM-barrel fold metal-dependent hydrolase